HYDIYAKTLDPIERVQVIATDGTSHTRDVEIRVHVSGYLKQDEQRHRPQFYANVLHTGAGEEYDLTTLQIASILATRSVAAFEESPFGASVPVIAQWSSGILGDRLDDILGVHATVDVNPIGGEKTRFLLSREIFERLLITYSSTLQIHGEPRIEVEYQINRGVSVTGERNERATYGFDLKLEQRF
ncbi:MAG: translocation/assembly module TamB domain-containing protein, partial [Candidatus Poribacteria bacterium]|nr:translocation/assembly module TamB domain-containing protein [Candidatus Poribacteria bacterium]